MEEYEDENILLDESTLEGEQGTSGNVMAVQVQNISLNLASYLRLMHINKNRLKVDNPYFLNFRLQMANNNILYWKLLN